MSMVDLLPGYHSFSCSTRYPKYFITGDESNGSRITRNLLFMVLELTC